MVKLDIPPHVRASMQRRLDLQRASSNLGDSLSPYSDFYSKELPLVAIAYARHGWAVLPLHTIRDRVCTCTAGARCSSPGKHPIAAGVHSATTDVAQVARLWRKYPNANIGVATGKISGVVVIDIDPRNNGSDTCRQLADELGKLPFTLYSDTGGGGSHRVFTYPDIPLATSHSTAGLSGLDLQSDGAYIVAPPSRHISGRSYRWRAGRDPASLPLVALPGRWLDRLRKSSAPPSPALATTALSNAIREGGRNTHLTSRAGALRQAGLSAEGLLAVLRVENAERCTPPLDDDEVERVATSVSRYTAGPPGSGDEAEGVMNAVLDQHYAGGAHLLRPSDGQFWAFDGTRWAPLNAKVLAGIVLTAIQAVPGRRGQNTASLMQQVLKLIEARVAADGDPLRFSASPLPVINCRNGELWIGPNGTFDLRPHNPTSYLRHRLEVVFDPAATCPRFDAAVLGIFGAASDPTAMAAFWDEVMGYAIQPDRRIPLVVLGWGSGNNGKTRLLETLVRLIGLDLVVAMPIGDLDKSRFTTGNLLGKLALIDDDVRAGTRLPDGHLKRLSEEKTMTGEHKFGPPFTFTARTAIFMLFNNPPSLADLSHGMQRRLMVIPFDRIFTADETDRGLFPAIWAEELPGVLNRYLSGLRRVIARRWAFAPPEAAVEAKERLLRAANPVPAFVDECCERSGSVYVQVLYEAYKEWADRAGVTLIPQRIAFQRTLEHLGFVVGRGSEGPKIHGLTLRAQPASSWPRRA